MAQKIPLSEITQIADFFVIVHHLRGRIRIRANLKNLDKAKVWAQNTNLRHFLTDSQSNDMRANDTQEMIIALLKRLRAIKEIKVNALIGSATITYDANLFEPNLWESWVKKERLEEITAKLNDFSRDIKEV
ncbi:HMA2 domain-containing protein [Helicobacter himalayensis]|uniref:HMA2 domain-containing protein n=1 Tax=Helicobacter himalayensis TaxID=1591088 RepID=UPI003D6E5740